jgi:hypothetical protein
MAAHVPERLANQLDVPLPLEAIDGHKIIEAVPWPARAERVPQGNGIGIGIKWGTA